MNPGDALLHNPPDLFKHVGVLLVHPVSQISTIVQDLTGKKSNTFESVDKHINDHVLALCVVESYVCLLCLHHWYHVGLPALGVDAMINAPPEIIFRFSLPGKHRHT